MGRHNAGMDLTEALKLAPHGSEKVAAMHERVFFMAYMNLTIVKP